MDLQAEVPKQCNGIRVEGPDGQPAGRARSATDKQVADGQGELFPAWRHHAVFSDSPLDW